MGFRPPAIEIQGTFKEVSKRRGTKSTNRIGRVLSFPRPLRGADKRLGIRAWQGCCGRSDVSRKSSRQSYLHRPEGTSTCSLGCRFRRSGKKVAERSDGVGRIHLPWEGTAYESSLSAGCPYLCASGFCSGTSASSAQIRLMQADLHCL